MLLPETSVTLCPEEGSVRFVCYESDISALFWIVEPYISYYHPVVFPSSEINANSLPIRPRGPITARVTNLTRNGDTLSVADIVSELIVNRSGIDSGTVITCQTYRGIDKSQTSSSLFYAGK